MSNSNLKVDIDLGGQEASNASQADLLRSNLKSLIANIQTKLDTSSHEIINIAKTAVLNNTTLSQSQLEFHGIDVDIISSDSEFNPVDLTINSIQLLEWGVEAGAVEGWEFELVSAAIETGLISNTQFTFQELAFETGFISSIEFELSDLGFELGLVEIGSLAETIASYNPSWWGDTSEAYAKSKFAVESDGTTNMGFTANGMNNWGIGSGLVPATLVFWVNLDAGSGGLIVDSTGGNSGFRILHQGTNVSARVLTDGSNFLTLATNDLGMSYGAWYMIALVYDGTSTTNSTTVYASNGSTMIETAVTAVQTGTFAGVGNADYNILNGSGGNIDGKLDQFIPFNKALSSTEITALYNSGNGVHHKDLVGTESYYSSIAAWYDFNTIPNFGRDYHGESHAVRLGSGKKLTVPYQSGGAFDRAFNEPWSFVTWAKPSAVAGGYDQWFFKYDPPKYIESYNTTGTSFVFFINESSTNRIVVTFTTTFDVTNQFVHIAFTYDGSTNASGVKMYLNGVEQTNRTVTSDTLTATTNLAVSTDFGNASEHTFDELSIYHDELTSTEVTTLYNGGIVAPARTLHTDNLVSDYSFNEQHLELIGRDSHGSNDLTPVSIVESDLVGGKGSLDLTEVSIDSSNAVLGHIEGAAAGSDEVTRWTDRSASGFDAVQSIIADTATYVGNGFGDKGSLKDGRVEVNPEPFDFTGDFSVGCWFKQDELTQFRFPIGIWGASGFQSFGIRNGSSGAGIQFVVSHDGSAQSNTAITDKPITAGEWYFGYGYHENGVQIGFRMFNIRGQEIGVEVTQPHTTGAYNSTSPFRIGGHTDEWNGEVGDNYIFNRKLTDVELQSLIDYSLLSIKHEGFISEVGMELVIEQTEEIQISELGIEIVVEEV